MLLLFSYFQSFSSYSHTRSISLIFSPFFLFAWLIVVVMLLLLCFSTLDFQIRRLFFSKRKKIPISLLAKFFIWNTHTNTHSFRLVLSISQSHSLQIGFCVFCCVTTTETYISFSVFNEVHLNGNVFLCSLLCFFTGFSFPFPIPFAHSRYSTQLLLLLVFWSFSFSFHFICGRHA